MEEEKKIVDENDEHGSFELARQLVELRESEEQLRVQLAGCGCAALGYAKTCAPGDYGYSPALEDVRTAVDGWRDRALSAEKNFGIQLEETGELEKENSELAASRKRMLATLETIAGCMCAREAANSGRDCGDLGLPRCIVCIARDCVVREQNQ